MRIFFFPAPLCLNEIVKFGSGGDNEILIVEDKSDMRDLLALRVQITGYLPVLASDGKAGVEKPNQDKPDLILMDMMMPGMVGRRRGRSEPPEKRKTSPSQQRPHWFVLRI